MAEKTLKRIKPKDVKELIEQARIGIKEKKTERRREEPGLTEEARYFVVKF